MTLLFDVLCELIVNKDFIDLTDHCFPCNLVFMPLKICFNGYLFVSTQFSLPVVFKYQFSLLGNILVSIFATDTTEIWVLGLKFGY